MAIKRVAILLEIDTGDKTNASGTCRSDQAGGPSVPGADETYVVNITDGWHSGLDGKPNKAAMMDSCAHELGHVMSSVFKVKGGMHEDPRQKGEFKHIDSFDEARRSMSADQAGRLWHNEELAWELALKIRPEVNREQMQEALDTYSWAKRRAD